MWGRINVVTRDCTERNTPDCRGKPTAPFFGARTWNGKRGVPQRQSSKRAVQKDKYLHSKQQ